MKKIAWLLLVFLLSFQTIFAYSPTLKDTNTLKQLYAQIDLLITKNPKQAEKLNQNIIKIIPSLKKDDRNKYLITNLWDYLSGKLNPPTESQNFSEVIISDVIDVIDWDTIKIVYKGKQINVRMIWIDSPENSVTRFWYIEKYWDQAKLKLIELISNKKITIELDETQWEYDKYDRLLAYVFLWGVNINQKMIELWYAKEYTYNKAYKYQKEFKEAQKNAENNQVWIWKIITEDPATTPTPVTPTETAVEKKYITGPEWGCYYINSNWNKTYVERFLCWNSETPSLNQGSSSWWSSKYIKWPKWWCYYYNSKGNKSYVDRSLCD